MLLFRCGILASLFAVLFAQPAPDFAARTRELLDQVLAGKYEPVWELWTPEMKQRMPFDAFKTQLVQLRTLGKPESIGESIVGRIDEFQVVTIPVHWQALTLNFRISWTKDGRIGGTWFLPGQAASSPPWQRPSYSKPDTFREREVIVGEGEWKLPGTLAVPVAKGPHPAVVLVHGSGSVAGDRDETVFANKVFKDLAEGFASRGVAVLRYEKRTKAYPAKMAALKDLTLRQETIEDAVKAAALLRTQPDIDPKRVFVLGHSLGGYAAPRIGKQDEKLAGLILFAASSRPIEDLIIEQNEYMIALKGGLSPEEQRQFDEVKLKVAQIKALEPGKDAPSSILGMPISYLLDLKGYDPVAEAKKLAIPMLILQGERDFQVSMKDFALWKQALGERKNVTFHSYPSLSHLFVAGEGKGTIQEYQKPGHVAPEVIDDVAKWVAAIKPAT
jgi:dienelactone hydrolase